MVLTSCFIICGGWLDKTLMYLISSFGLLYGLYVSSVRLNVTSKKLTRSMLLIVSILKLVFLYMLSIFLHIFTYVQQSSRLQSLTYNIYIYIYITTIHTQISCYPIHKGKMDTPLYIKYDVWKVVSYEHLLINFYFAWVTNKQNSTETIQQNLVSLIVSHTEFQQQPIFHQLSLC